MPYKNTILTFLIFFCHLSISYSQNSTVSVQQFLIKFKKESSTAQKNALKNTLSATKIKEIPQSQIELWELPQDSEWSVSEIINNFQQHPDIEYIAPNHTLILSQLSNNNPIGSPPPIQQWGLNNTGQNNGLAGADIDAVAAMNIRSESPNIKIGIIDSGIDWTHPDLVHNIWQNTEGGDSGRGEDLDGDGRVIEWDAEANIWVFDPDDVNGIDDDGNGYIDDFIGWDFKGMDNNPFDENGHGTHIAGIIGADGMSDEGINGVTWNVQMAALKIFGEHTASGTTIEAIEAMLYAKEKGFQITNNSYGSGFYNPALYETMDSIDSQLFIASAGNDGLSVAHAPRYPAAFDLPNIVSVAASNHYDRLASFSSYHPTEVDVAAPGKTIFSTLPHNTYGFKSGTSMSTAFVTGAVALVMAECPDATLDMVKSKLIQSADPLPSLAGTCAANGRLNVNRLLQFEGSSAFKATVTPHNLEVFFLPEDDSMEFLWDFNDGTSQVATGPISHTFSTHGWFTVCVQSTQDCGTAKTCERIVVTSPTTCEIEFFEVIDSESNNDNLCVGDNPSNLGFDFTPHSDDYQAVWTTSFHGSFQSYEPLDETAYLNPALSGPGMYRFSLILNGPEDTCMADIIQPIFNSARNLDLGEDLSICDDHTELIVDLPQMVEYNWYKDGEIYEANGDSAIQIMEPGMFELEVIDQCGVTIRDTVHVQLQTCDTWPGDTDYNGIVDARDIFQLFCQDGETGPPRPAMPVDNTTWQAQAASDWNEGLGVEIDSKHSDCDGDGLVSLEADVAAIDLNYNKIHTEGFYYPLENPHGSIKLQPHFIEKISSEDSTAFKIDLHFDPVTVSVVSFSINYKGFGSRAFLELENSVFGTPEEVEVFTNADLGTRLDVVMWRKDKLPRTITTPGPTKLASFIIIDQNIATGDTTEILQVSDIHINNVRMSEECIDKTDIGSSSLSLIALQDNDGNRNSSNMVLAVRTQAATCIEAGQASIEVFGGTPPYTFAWENGQVTATANNLMPGVHQVTVTDATHEVLVGRVHIQGLPSLQSDLDIVAHDDGAFDVHLTSTGGVGTHSYQWSDGQTGTAAFNLSEGKYYVKVSDQTSCRDSLFFKLSIPSLTVPLRNTENPSNSSIPSTSETGNIYIRPTLVDDRFQIFFDAVPPQKMPLYIYDTMGRLVRHINIETTDTHTPVNIDFQDQLPGLYYVKLGQISVFQTFKLVKL